MELESWAAAAAVVAASIAIPRLLGGRRAPVSEVARRVKAGATIVDVRSEGEFASGAYPGAVNIPLGSLGRRMGEIPRDRPVVLYCASGVRSGSAARMLRGAGYAEVLNAGGLRQMPW
jgi:phage shock protein E